MKSLITSATIALLISHSLSCIQISNVQIKNGNKITDAISNEDELTVRFKIDSGNEKNGYNFNCDEMKDFKKGE